MKRRIKDLKEQELFGLILVRFANAKSAEVAKKALFNGLKKVNILPKEQRNNEGSLKYPKNIELLQKEVTEILDSIINETSLKKNEAFQRFLDIYNSDLFRFYYVTNKNTLIRKSVFKTSDKIKAETLIAYNLINFLDSERNKLYLQRCKYEECKKFFIARKTGKVLKCPKCSKKSTWDKNQRRISQAAKRKAVSDPKKIEKIRELYKHMKEHGNNDEEVLDVLREYKRFTWDLIIRALPQLAHLVKKQKLLTDKK